MGAPLNVSPFQIGDGTSPFADPSSWNQITLQGITWVGKVEVKGASRKYKWHVKNAKGQEGALPTYQGAEPEKFAITFFIWTDLMWFNWNVILSSLFFYNGIVPAGADVIPISVQYPSLAAVGISALVTESIGALEKVSDDNMYSATVHCREYFPPKLGNANVTPAGAAAVSAVNKPGLTASPAVFSKQAILQGTLNIAASFGPPGGA